MMMKPVSSINIGSIYYSLSIIILALYYLYENVFMPVGITKKHSMGFKIKNIDIQNINNIELQQLKDLVSQHGVVVIENAANYLSAQDLLLFASKFGELIKLPNGFGFNTSDQFETESYISNITNIDQRTGLIKSVNTAEYLHNDGDFWQNNYIYTFLYGDVIPNIGGNTHFVDLELAHDYLYQYHKTDIFDLIDDKRVVIDVNDIPDFEGSPFLDEFNSKHNVARHDIIDKHIVTQKPVLFYACKFAKIDGFTMDESRYILDKIDNILMNNDFMSYQHEWNENDLLIWDNTRVMHRSMGGYYLEPRKLLRAQSRLNLKS